MTVKIAAVVLFNHPFEKNIPPLRQLYEGRFSDCLFVSPFYRGEEADVVPTYRSSFYHGSYVCDAIGRLRDVDCEYVLVIHDDVLLNPKINQDNLLGLLGLEGGLDAFVPHFRRVSTNINDWDWTLGTLLRLVDEKNPLCGTGYPGLQFLTDTIKTSPYGLANLEHHFGPHLETKYFRPTEAGPRPSNFYAHRGRTHRTTYELVASATNYLMRESDKSQPFIKLPFPLITTGSMGDFLLIKKERLDTYAHYVGMMSSAGMFTEVGIPLSLLCACPQVESLPHHTRAFRWAMGPNRLQYESEARIEEDFANGEALALHPVKLSRLSATFLERLRGTRKDV